MEKKFYQDNFEQLLKESTENFRMYPSKRVWHGIYNNLHPSRRWPSLAVWLLLISSMIFIGLSNKNKFTGVAGNNAQQQAETDTKTGLLAQNDNSPVRSYPSASTVSANTLSNPVPPTEQSYSGSSANSNAVVRSYKNNHRTSVNITSGSESSLVTDTKLTNDARSTDVIDADESNGSSNQDIAFVNNTRGNVNNNPEKLSAVISSTVTTELSTENDKTKNNDPLKELQDKKTESEQKKDVVTNKTNTTEKEWIEDYAFHNKPAASKWRSSTSYEFYFTPSVGYRVLSKNSNFNPVYNSLIASSNNSQDYQDALSQGSAVNMELGASLIYKLSKNWNFKAGLQLNYTNYAINVYELKHPTVTTLLLNDLNNGMTTLDPRSTNLANISGVSTKKLKNNTYQVSIPVGADFRLAGRNNLKWYVGGTIQPTYIAGGHSYLISSDMKNYVADNSFMRKWNLNAALETFISYKTKGGLTVNAGPLFRYQFLSTNSRQYTYNENLYSLGFKLGIITKF